MDIKKKVRTQFGKIFLSIFCSIGLLNTYTIFGAEDEFNQNLDVDRGIQSYIVKFRDPGPGEARIIAPPRERRLTEDYKVIDPVPFGEHTSGQTKEEIAGELDLFGEIVSIYDSLNAIHIRTDAIEVERLRNDPRVLRVTEDKLISTQTTQSDPGWALDRIDETTVTLDDEYTYTADGSGQTIYILDSGLNVGWNAIAAEFGGPGAGMRAFMIYDIQDDTGIDCTSNSHGTKVAVIAASETYGVAKGATVLAARITEDCTGSSYISTSVAAFNWLANNADPGSIVNWSHGLSNDDECASTWYETDLEEAIEAAHDAGVIVVVAAGNDGCDTSDFSPTNIPESFVVGGTQNDGIGSGDDEKWPDSRTGTNISTFAPGKNVPAIDKNAFPSIGTGTSFAAPMVAGIFAVVCDAGGTICQTNSAASLYTALRNEGVTGTVTEPGGGTLVGATSRFIPQKW